MAMIPAAPRIHPRLLDVLEREACRRIPIAEVRRRVRARAVSLGLPSPSYEQVRRLVHAARERAEKPSTAEVLVDVALRARAPEEFLQHVAGVGVRQLRPK